MRRRVRGGRQKTGKPRTRVPDLPISCRTYSFPEGVDVLVTAIEDVRRERGGWRIVLRGNRPLETLVAAYPANWREEAARWRCSCDVYQAYGDCPCLASMAETEAA